MSPFPLNLANLAPARAPRRCILLLLVGWMVGLVVGASGCTSLAQTNPLDAVQARVQAQAQADRRPVQFETSQGPVSPARSAAILQRLEQQADGATDGQAGGSGGDQAGGAGAGNSDILQRHLAVEQAINASSPLVLGNRLRLLQDGPATYAAMFAAMGAARDHIHLETYIFADDAVGRQFADVLLQKQAAGVQVNLIVDSVGSLGTPAAFFQRLKDAGVQVLEYNPVNPLAARKPEWRLNNRDHRKLLVVDGRTAFIGGININASYASGSSSVLPGKRASAAAAPDEKGWRDTHLQIDGPVVAEFQKLFLDTWARQKGPPLALRQHFPAIPPQGDHIVRAIGSRSEDTDSLIYATLLSAIEHAEERVYMTVAYFVPDARLLQSLTDAAQRGVDVRLVLPSHTDSWAVFHAGRSHYTRLLRAGVKLYERRGTVLHAKTVTVDGVWSTIGSTNLDWRSFLHNDELNGVVLGRAFAQQLEAMFREDLTQSDAVELRRWQRRSPLLRLQEWSARLIEYWL